MLKRVLLFAFITFSLVDAQFISSPSVLQRAEKFLQRYTESSDSTYTVYEVKGNIKLPMKVDVPIENFGGRYIINLNCGTRNIRVNDFEEFNLRKIASEDLRNYFNNEVLNSSKITRVAFEHQQRNGQSEIVGGIVMFHQLVQNVIVRGDAFIFLYYDALSNLKKIEYSWLNVKKKIKKIDFCKECILESHMDKLEQEISRISRDIKSENMQGELYDAVRSWRMTTDSSGNGILVPCLTYLGHFDDKGTIRYISFDVDEIF